MNVSYVVPLRSAWSRMLRMLFRPFQIEVWLVLGFGAFLSEYLSWGFPGSRFGFRPHHRAFPHEALRRAVDFLRNPFGMMLVLWIVVAALALLLLFMWISSRGKFIFLDNVLGSNLASTELPRPDPAADGLRVSSDPASGFWDG